MYVAHHIAYHIASLEASPCPSAVAGTASPSQEILCSSADSVLAVLRLAVGYLEATLTDNSQGNMIAL